MMMHERDREREGEGERELTQIPESQRLCREKTRTRAKK